MSWPLQAVSPSSSLKKIRTRANTTYEQLMIEEQCNVLILSTLRNVMQLELKNDPKKWSISEDLQTSQTQPEPKRVIAASTNFSLKFAKEPKSFSICRRRPSFGESPPPGCIDSQKKSWFQTYNLTFIKRWFASSNHSSRNGF